MPAFSRSAEGQEGAVRTIRDLRRLPGFDAGTPVFESLVKSYLPLVNGSVALLLPEDPASHPEVVTAIFRTFAVRWRKTPRRMLLASWFVRTTWFVARRERHRLSLSLPPPSSPGASPFVLYKTLSHFAPRTLDAVVLRYVLQETTESAGAILRRKPSRVEKSANRGLRKLSKRLKRFPDAPAPAALLATISCSVPPETQETMLGVLSAPPSAREKSSLVRAAISGWQWLRIKRLMQRALAGMGVSVGLLALAAFTFIFLATHGYLTPFFIRRFNGSLLSEFPELKQPAKAWPSSPDGRAAAQSSPTTAAELYSLTNIWSARLSFSSASWRGLQPKSIPPANMNGGDGHMTLRNPKARRNGLAGVIGLDFDWVEARLTFAGADYPKVAVRYRGNGTFVNSLYGPKQSLKVDMNRFSKAQVLAGVHTLNFVNAVPDFSYVHDALAERFFRDLGVPAPRTAYSYLTVDAPGRLQNQPLGLYVLVENVDADFAHDRFGSKKVPIFKPVTPELFKDLGDDWKAYAGIYDLKTKATPEQLHRVIEFARLVTGAPDQEFAERLPEFLDLEEFAAFLAGHILLSSYDGFLSNGQNFYLFLDPVSNRFGFIPWDHDHAWGEFGYVATADKRERASIWKPSTYDNRFLERVLKVEAFRSVYRQTLERARRELFTVERLYAQVDALAAAIRPAVAAESDFRLRRFDIAISTNWLAGPRDGAPEGPRAPTHQIKRFIANRAQSVQQQLEGTAEGVVLNHDHRH